MSFDFVVLFFVLILFGLEDFCYKIKELIQMEYLQGLIELILYVVFVKEGIKYGMVKYVLWLFYFGGVMIGFVL